MDINAIDKIIRRIPMEKRLSKCQKESKKRIGPSGPIIPSYNSYKSMATNYEMELIAIRCVVTDTNPNYKYKNDKWWNNIINLLREKNSFGLINDTTDEIIKNLLYQQIETQVDYKILYYRFEYIFNYKDDYVNMKHEFKKKFKIYFESFVKVSFFIMIWSSIDEDIPVDKFIKKLINSDELIAFEEIITTKENIINMYKNKYNLISKDRNDYFDLNLLIQYPIIDYNQSLYIPYVPFVPYACTTSLLFKLTENNNKLRTKLGPIMENYLTYLIKNSLVTSSLYYIGEFEYGKQKIKSSDIILKSNNNLAFIESKMIIPSLKVRASEEESIKNLKRKISKAMIQICRNINDYRENKMGEYIEKGVKNIYGLVITYGDIFYSTEDSYKETIIESKIKGYNISEEEIMNIKIISLITFENYLNLHNEDLFSLLKNGFSNGNLSRISNYKDKYIKLVHFNESEIRNRIKTNIERTD